MAPAEMKRFVDRLGLADLVDDHGKSYEANGLKYMKLSASELIAKIERDPKLLRLPLVRFGTRVSAGQDQNAWREMVAKP